MFVLRSNQNPTVPYLHGGLGDLYDLVSPSVTLSWPASSGYYKRDIVRIAPNDLSFITPQAYRDIYGQPQKGRKLFPKPLIFWKTINEPGMTHITDVDKAAKHRELLSPGFNPRALRNQESVIHHYADLFVDTLRRLSAGEHKEVDIGDAFNWVTFDILGELAFGESFNAVKNAKTHFWTSVVTEANFIQILPGLLIRLPILKLLSPWFMTKEQAAVYDMHRNLTMEKTRKRIRLGNAEGKADFFSHVLKGELTEEELASHASVFMVAGGETTSVVLTGAATFLAQNRRCFEKLRDEVLAAFGSTGGQGIDGEATARLPYLKAVVEESVRLFPPVSGFPRVSPGETVDGAYIPAGVVVLADTRTMARDPRNFGPDPDEFRPERWIDPKDKDAMNRKLTNLGFVPGPRGCLGLNMAQVEMRIILAKLVYAFDWELVGADGLDLVRKQRQMVMTTRPRILARFHPRQT
ncbi:uncharacterized protein PG998_007063 [Apiospora kogelbergensis]|uniref:uncharacterized protein n=1 Tax=Apiospora kogelbergensis TaxID=1337665 RepID=UPI0031306E28